MIDYLPLKEINAMHGQEIASAVQDVVTSGWYLRGEQTMQFETSYAEYIGTRHCIAVANGLDALTLILRAYIELGKLHVGDEVLVPANTYIASILSITENGLVPILVEPRIDNFQIDDSLLEYAVTDRTRALMIVHLYGCCAYTEHIAAFCKAHNLILIEDNAQAHGCIYNPSSASVPSLGESQGDPNCRPTGSLGHAATHSFYPGKNLGALGDAGAVTTDDDSLAELIRTIANYGSSRKYVFDYLGRNSRMDELQAAVLRVKLKYLDEDNERRRQIALRYAREIHNEAIIVPSEDYCSNSVHHIFPVLSPRRDALQQYLAEHGVQTIIHYPIPPHRQRCYAQWAELSLPITERIHREELSLPCHPAMTDEQAQTVIDLLNRFS